MKSADADKKIRYFNERGDRWDQIVGNDPGRREVLRGVFDMIAISEGSRVLDAGCGNGVLFTLIEERIGGGGEIAALDPAPAMIARARELHPGFRNIRYAVGTAEECPFDDGSFDAVLCFAVFPHVHDKAAALREFHRVLKKGARLYIFHLSDTKTLNDFHGSLDAPVRGDTMPGREELEAMLAGASFTLTMYIDRPGLNFAGCVSC